MEQLLDIAILIFDKAGIPTETEYAAQCSYSNRI
jgi:hypothetical protein